MNRKVEDEKHTLQAELESLRREVAGLKADNEACQQEINTLKADNTLLRALFNAVPGLIHAIDRDFNIIEMSDALREAYIPQVESPVAGQKCWEIYKGQDGPCERCSIRMVFESGQSHVRALSEATNKRVGFTGMSYASPIRNEHGEAMGAVELLIDVTELNRAKAALQASEERYRLLFNMGNDLLLMHPLMSKESPRKFTEVNDMACRVLGYSKEEMLNLTPMDIVTEAGRLPVPQESEQLIEQGELLFEKTLVTKDGRHIPVEIHANLFDYHGQPTVLSIARDITERKRIECALRESEARFRRIFEDSPIGIVQVDMDGHILMSNPALEFMLDYTGEGLREMAFTGLIHPDDRALHEGLFNEMAEGKCDSYQIETRCLNRGGKVIWVQVNTALIRDENGHPSGIIGMIQDVSVRKKALEDLVDSERRYRLLAENVQDVIWTMDRDYRFTYISPSIRELRGLEPEEAMRESIADTMTPESYQKVCEVIAKGWEQEAQGKGHPVSYFEVQQKRKDGSLIWVEIMTQPVWDERGQRTGFLGVSRNITRRKQLEEQLLQSQKMEAIGRLAGGIAHDFNNILTIIRGNVEFLMDGIDSNDPRYADLEDVRKAAERAALLTRQLLAFGRRQILQPTVLDLNQAINNLLKMLRRLIGEDIALEMNLASALGRIKADPGQIEQVILNLVINARQAMPRGGTLTIETGNVILDEAYTGQYDGLEPGPYLKLIFRDTGIGIDPTTAKRIFEPFFSTKDHGTGLGLATVYGIVTQSGGHIEVESEPARGSAFTIYLPQTGEEPGFESILSESADLPTGTETVLLVEDEEFVRHTISRALRTGGYTVHPAPNGEEALRLYAGLPKPVELLVTDVIMPGGMNGRELAERLTALDSGLKTLFVSGHTGEVLSQHGVEQLGSALLYKPFTLSVLLKKVREVLDERREKDKS